MCDTVCWFAVHQPPRLETIENLMKLSQMIIQAMEEKASPLQQLPHIQPDMLRHFTTRRVSWRADWGIGRH